MMKFAPWARIAPVLMALAAVATLPIPAAARPDPGKIKVAILIFNNVQVIDYSGPLEVLSDAGFDVFTVAASKDAVTTSAGDAVKLTPKYTFDDAPQADLIVIPGGGFEAAKDSATDAWIKRESPGAMHIMSVCNGAFTLANTGLLDGLKATTTAGNINRLRQSFPAIKVTPDERVVDNGKVVTTAGLSAGIDGALHMVDVIKGEGAGRSVALAMEYDWRPNGDFVRGVMADRFIPNVFRIMRSLKAGDDIDETFSGGNDGWETTVWYAPAQSPAELFAGLTSAYASAYAQEGAWAPGSVQMTSAGPLATTLTFKDRQGQAWQGRISLEPVPGEVRQVAVKVAVNRAG